MKTAAIIAEYNPFHDGHRYHIEQTRSLTGATHVVIVMSGNFTQRGDVAILPKHTRAKAALQNGADLVVELPVAFALSSAEQFATGAVTILNKLGCVDLLSFGSECGDTEILKDAAGAVHYAQTTDEFFAAMKSGKTYPAALQSAVEKYYTDDVVGVLTGANNTLAVEYIKALNESGSSIQPFTVKRIGAGHDEHILPCNESLDLHGKAAIGIKSASQIRKELLQCEKDGKSGDYADILRLETAILAKLRLMSPNQIKRAPNVHGGLENRIFKAARAARSLSELYFLSKMKRYTLARIRRAVLCCFLGINVGDVKIGPQYIRILGMNSRGREILGAADESAVIDSSLATLMKKSDLAKRQALLEERCTNIYSLAFEKRRVCGKEFTEKVVVL
ncbi:MAG: nucleotidyltransferase family protein [Oscillospiraceae bacterium]|nr:nucleotidyltransferase family protein [Oscillospiraceae bacterium]